MFSLNIFYSSKDFTKVGVDRKAMFSPLHINFWVVYLRSIACFRMLKMKDSGIRAHSRDKLTWDLT